MIACNYESDKWQLIKLHDLEERDSRIRILTQQQQTNKTELCFLHERLDLLVQQVNTHEEQINYLTSPQEL